MKTPHRPIVVAVLGACLTVSAGALHAQTLDASLDNGTVKVGVSRAYGGAITWFSASGGTNLVNDYDLGRQVQQSYYAGDRVVGPNQCPYWSPFHWNPIQAGDCGGYSGTVLSLSATPTQIYVKTEPKLWDRRNMPAKAHIEQWTTLHPTIAQVVIVDNVLTAFRDPNDVTDEWGGARLAGQELPASYFGTCLNTIKTYTGTLPWQDDTLSIIPSTWPPNRFTATECWSAVLDLGDWGVGLFTPLCTVSLAGMAGSPVACNPFSNDTMYLSHQVVTGLGYTSVYSYRYYLILGNVSTIRWAVYQLHSAPPKPAIPAGLIATPGNGQVNLTWTAAPDATSYNVLRATVSGGPYTPVATGVTGTTYSDTGLMNGVRHFYVVAATNGAGTSENSTEASAAPAALDVNVPNHGFETPVISGFQYNPVGGGWTFASGSGIAANASGFTSGNLALHGTQVAFAQGLGNFSQMVGGFQSGVFYTVDFSAAQRANHPQAGQTWNVTLDGAVIGSFAPPQSSTAYFEYRTPPFWTSAGSHTLAFRGTNLSGGDNTVLIDDVRVVGTTTASPTGLSATATKRRGRINLAWTQSATPGVVQNGVYRALRTGGPYTLTATIPATTSYIDSGLAGGRAYYYVVTAVTGGGLESPYSNESFATAK